MPSPSPHPTPGPSPERARIVADLRRSVPAGRLAVAFSGGADSTLLLALAAEALGAARVLAVTARSDSLPAAELAACRELAAGLGVRLVVLETDELARPGYRENGPDRCYHCKTELFERLEERLLPGEDVVAVAYGANADDRGDHRPGQRAAREHAVLAPLEGLTKAAVRALSRELGLPTWDKPARPCLASRIPYGEAVTPEKLRRVEAAEELLGELGLADVRVRHHDAAGGPLARIEVPLGSWGRFAAAPVRERIVAGLREAGFRYVSLDLEGFRSGRLNEAILDGGGGRKLPLVGAGAGEERGGA